MKLFLKVTVVLIIFLSGMQHLRAQEYYYPAKLTDSADKAMRVFKAEIEKHLADLQDKNKEFEKYINEIRKAQRTFLLAAVDSGQVVYDPVLYNYVDNVFTHILESNKLDRKNYVLLILKDGIPNAYNFGDGVIVVNLGLMPYMTNVYQLAMVLAHELAHDLGKHVSMAAKKNYDLMHSEELKYELEKIKRSEYNASLKLRKLLKSYGLNVNKHSRNKEFEADSVGFRLYEKTGYFKMEAIEMLMRLDSVDKPFYKEPYDLAAVFGTDEYPYRNVWEYYEEPIFNQLNEESDTAKTHPDCPKRIAAIFKMIPADNNDPEFHDAEYEKMMYRCEWLLLEGAMRLKNYGEVCYRSLEMLRRYPDDQKLYEVLAFSIHRIYAYQERHDLDKVVELPNTIERDNYDKCLTFLHNLSQSDLLKIGYNVTKQYNEKYAYKNYNMLSYQISFATKLLNKNKVSELNQICITKFSERGTCNQFEKPILTFK